MSTKTLPERPNLGHLKYQARDLLAAASAGDPSAVQRLIDYHPEFAHLSPAQAAARAIKLADAQLVIAREYGFTSWPKLKDSVDENSGREPHTRILDPDYQYNEERATAIFTQLADGLPSIIAQVKRCHPAYAEASVSEIKKAKLTGDDARLIYARDHGFSDWHAMTARLEALNKGDVEEPFLTAFQAIKAGDAKRLKSLLDKDPSLVRARGTNDNTLLNLAVGVKQTAAARVLIEAGADVNFANNRGWTPLHAAGYGNQVELIEPLIRAGADVEAYSRGDGGTPLAMALFWGHREAGDALARHGVVPLNLRMAAGAGRLDLVQSFFEKDGALKPESRKHRGFYRPHGGFPQWKPSSNRKEVLDEAFTYACRSGRIEVLDYLIKMGADIDGDPYRGTGLTWAATKGRLETMRWLLDHGARINRRGSFGGPGHGQAITALHIAAQSGQMESVKLLVERGADISIRDQLYGGSPMGWANQGGHREISDFLGPYCPIEDAAHFGYIDRVKALLDENPRLVNGKKVRGAPLLRAVTGDQPQIAALLIERGADKNATDAQGKTALAIALELGHDRVAEVLRQHGATE
ncbi:MAG TPA: ankyrin repeat domain-containing protein [Capsulimonadaceae bacterium]|nr:ankyrin repeat domain-containing protein [Capsulimonadaceae bacterium]